MIAAWWLPRNAIVYTNATIDIVDLAPMRAQAIGCNPHRRLQ
jgi:hypothetical protein